MKKLLSIFIVMAFVGGCVSTKPPSVDEVPVVEQSRQPDESERIYSVFLVGDAGDSSLDPLEPSLAILREQLQEAGEQSAVIFLGDNVYPHGLPPEGHRRRTESEMFLQAQFKTVENYAGQVVFLAGNHDWKSSSREGLEYLQRQERFVEESLNRGNVFLPDNGQPGPAVVKAGNEKLNLSIVVLDTQWWLHPHKKPGAETDSAFEASSKQAIQKLRAAVTDEEVDQVLVAGHHPIYSNGTNGGKFPLKTHLVPPVGGSLYVLYRNLVGTAQDISSGNYGKFKAQLASVFMERDPLIYASGHDHNLQYITFGDKRRNQYYIVSGSASVSSYVRTPESPNFGIQQKGFGVLHYYKNSIWVEFWNEKGNRLFEQQVSVQPKNIPVAK
ncbi:metallophosphoesterase [Fodinibius sp. Rm-B-1B1-1]|uniref:metallophosphoesterase n=1 Tax=Fodinibius alkaliphilus TaxID=3140241 RepID=UPI00315AE69E